MSDTVLKITSYNVHSCIGSDGIYSMDRIAGVLLQSSAHIICLQEIEVNDNATQTRIWSTLHCDDQPSYIASKLGMEYFVFAPAIRSKAKNCCKEKHFPVSTQDIVTNKTPKINDSSSSYDMMDSENQMTGKFGIAILSRYPILQIQTHQYLRYKHKTIRNAVACLIALPNNTKVWVVNTHLGCHIWGYEQYYQSQELVTFMESLSISDDDDDICGIILCGDFNSLPYFSSIYEITLTNNNMFVDTWCQAGIGNGATFPSNALLSNKFCCCLARFFRLDYIFVQGCRNIIIKQSYTQNDIEECRFASDHLPLCTVLIIHV